MKKYCLSLILILCLCMSYFLNLPSYSVSAEARKLEIVALGDSITTGYKLDGYDASNVSENTQIQNYVNLVATDKDAKVLNLAHDGDKAQDLLDILNDVDNIEIINKADVILISIGGNELLTPFMNIIGNVLLEGNPLEITISDIVTALNNNTDSLNTAIENYEQVFPSLLEKIVSLNKDAQVIFQAVYNPLENAKQSNLLKSFLKGTDNEIDETNNTIEENNDLTEELDYSELEQLYEDVDVFISSLNTSISNAIKEFNIENEQKYVFCDIHKVFNDYANENDKLLTNIDGDTLLDFDIHPNALGHQIIAEAISDIVEDQPVIREVETSIYVYVNNILLTPNSEEFESGLFEKLGIEGSETNEEKTTYTMYENESKSLKVKEEKGYKLIKIVGAELKDQKEISVKGDAMPPRIDVYYYKEYTVTYNVGLNGKLIIDGKIHEDHSKPLTKVVLFGNSISCNIECEYGYQISEITINNKKVDNTKISSFKLDNVSEDIIFSIQFKKIEKTEYLNESYNIKLTASTDSVDYGTNLDVLVISSEEDKYNNILECIDLNIAKATVFDFSLKKGNINVQQNGDITISIPVPVDYNKEKIKFYYVSNDYIAEEVNFAISEDNELVFKTSHCSYYVMIEEGVAAKNLIWLYILLAVLTPLIILAVVITIIIVKKRNKSYKAYAEANAKKDYISY